MPEASRSRLLRDIARSGLNPTDAQRLKLAALSKSETKRVSKHDTESYRVPYFTPAGKVTSFYRLRLFDPPTTFKKPDKEKKYWQPPKTLPQLYFAPLCDWKKVLTDIETPVYITEGEKKAARGCKAGLPVIGLGGVWSWRSAREKIGLIDDFKLITWTGRTVIVVFDSDVGEKVGVQQALLALSRQLVKLGATPVTVKLPTGPKGEKVGLDDYLEAESATAFKQLDKLPLLGDLGEELWKLNDELAYVQSLESVYRFKTRQLLDRTKLVSMAYANRLITVFSGADGKPKQVNAAAEWLAWPLRREHPKLTYAPGQPPVTMLGAVNAWSGWAVEPKRGDVTLFAQLIEHLFKNAPEHKRWFLQWLAYPLQHPGTKLYTAVVLFSLGTGIGKSLVALTLGRIYGQNFSEINQRDLHAGFNDWAAEKQFVLGDEITGSDRRADADLLNTFITRETVTINRKYQPMYTLPDCVNFYFTTNQPDAFYLNDKDRRCFVHEVPSTPLSEEFYAKYDAWYRSTDGVAALFDYFLKLDLTGFNPRARAPETLAKVDMIELSRSDLDAWAHALKNTPDDVLKLDGKPITRQLWTTSELRGIYDSDGAKKTTLIALSKALRRAGLRLTPPTLTHDGTKKLWALREANRWLRADHHERSAQYESERRVTTVKAVKF